MTLGAIWDGRRVLRTALVLGLLVRGVIFWQTGTLGTEIVDEQHYSQLASSILQGYGFAWDATHPTSIRPPLFPGMVAAIWTIAGSGNLQAVRLVQILLAALTTVLVFEIGRLAFDRDVGRYAAALFWLYPSLMFFNFMILTETLFTLLLVAFVLLTIMLVRTPRAWIALLCGVALGLAALTRSIVWPMPIVLCPLLAILLRGSGRARITAPALLLLSYVVVMTPWAARNTRLQGVLTIVDTMGGLNLRMGNYDYTPDDRMWTAVALTGEKNWSYDLANEHSGQPFTEGQRDRWAQRKAVAYMRANPWITLRRTLIKLADFWGLEREYAAGIGYGLFAPPHWFGFIGPLVIIIAYVGVVTLGAAGMWLAAPDRRIHAVLLLPVLLIMGIHAIAFGHSRYHVPLIPIFGVYAVSMLFAQGRIPWHRRGPMVVGAGAVVVAFVSIWVRQIVFVDAERIHILLRAAG